MTDDRRLEIERRFDSEWDGEEPAIPLEELVDDDPEARRYLDRLILLRDLARRHDPASLVARKPFALPDRRPRKLSYGWLAVASTAAAAVLLLWVGPRFRGNGAPTVTIADRPVKSSTRASETRIGRPPLEVALYGWANTPARAPRQAARLILSPTSPTRKRSPAVEILALELANATPHPRSGVQRFAVAKGSKPVMNSKPITRPKATFPDA